MSLNFICYILFVVEFDGYKTLTYVELVLVVLEVVFVLEELNPFDKLGEAPEVISDGSSNSLPLLQLLMEPAALPLDLQLTVSEGAQYAVQADGLLGHAGQQLWHDVLHPHTERHKPVTK